jgi:hypothetical protein
LEKRDRVRKGEEREIVLGRKKERKRERRGESMRK